MSGQEPEDVALAATEIWRWCWTRVQNLYTDREPPFLVQSQAPFDTPAESHIRDEVTRLVRAGQRRELEAVAKEVCDCCAEGEPVNCVDGEWLHDSEDWDGIEACLSGPVHARLALLREE